MPTLRVEIVTPDAILFSGEASALVARSTVGNLTIMAGHAMTIGDIVPSVVRVQTSASESAFAVHGGYFQVSRADEDVTVTTVLAGVAENVADIDVARAEAAKERLEAEITAASQANSDDHAALQVARSALERADLRLRAAARR